MTVQHLQFFLNNANAFAFLNFKFNVTLLDLLVTYKADPDEVPTLGIALNGQSSSVSSLIEPVNNNLINDQLTMYLPGSNPAPIYRPVEIETTRLAIVVATFVNPFEVLLSMRVGYGGKGVDLDQSFK